MTEYADHTNLAETIVDTVRVMRDRKKAIAAVATLIGEETSRCANVAVRAGYPDVAHDIIAAERRT